MLSSFVFIFFSIIQTLQHTPPPPAPVRPPTVSVVPSSPVAYRSPSVSTSPSAEPRTDVYLSLNSLTRDVVVGNRGILTLYLNTMGAHIRKFHYELTFTGDVPFNSFSYNYNPICCTMNSAGQLRKTYEYTKNNKVILEFEPVTKDLNTGSGNVPIFDIAFDVPREYERGSSMVVAIDMEKSYAELTNGSRAKLNTAGSLVVFNFYK